MLIIVVQLVSFYSIIQKTTLKVSTPYISWHRRYIQIISVPFVGAIVKAGDRVAQLILERIAIAEVHVVADLDDT
jgi:hypothetical protein